ncbi:hypothetical protein [Novacetimonas pomaceti]|uniref:hypothetical protein n=1 Tax=Novacetimonas pomaceti TaxID=2021998 RepID=UPI0014041B5A|nr:hypothetical protein [Novacetimonas pomaceti]
MPDIPAHVQCHDEEEAENQACAPPTPMTCLWCITLRDPLIACDMSRKSRESFW